VTDDNPRVPEALDIPEDMRVPSMEFGRLVATSGKSACAWALVVVGVIFAISLVTALQRGLDAELAILMGLALISLAAVWIYNFVGVLMAAGTPRQRWLVVPTLAIMLPYLLGFYLAAYRGLWHLLETARAFTWQEFAPAMLCLMLGWFLISRLARLVAIRQDIDAALRSPE